MTVNAYDGILSATPIRFRVGTNNGDFFVHSSLVASQSDMLKELVNGSTKDTVDDCIVWEHVTEDAFIRFGQYIYTGNYEGKAPVDPYTSRSRSTKSALKPTVPFEDISEKLSDEWSVITKTRNKENKTQSPAGARVRFQNVPAYDEHDAWNKFKTERSYSCGIIGSRSTPRNENGMIEYGQVFLSHARVHALADYCDIPRLAQMALYKLHCILCGFTLYNERICDVVELLQFCFEENGTPMLQDLVGAYTACHFKQLWVDASFQNLMASSSTLAAAVMEYLAGRLM